ncbi:MULTISPECIES: transcriptional coactivator p15/PC4 family protein [Paraburkholderia]|uniref:transcriptional coactivator p15/PC4 family protein n=1 Tax=Paraburkholderia TaxID=1822464 RepID=UPI00224D9626|nr:MULTISPECIES: transcriptional coactivator p15/PC4 family protein [Paraburkholderia]MCX4156141.1 transcriptional coactivator p15/PC4 family protein [Paraburkholderia aspalathi]MDN7165547.1 transcriptional coactivator p15/PC4 family protein [Paraburkholderia sp. SECH2]MDQ6394033.1 transcriptional coactivator p15/PC4 family protein [Paraburkholderia aspalathi]
MLTTQLGKGRDPSESATPTTTRDDSSAKALTRAGPLILDLQKSARERLRISHTNYRGKPYIDLRIWFVDEAGDYQPSRSGVSIRPSHIPEIVRALTLAGREVPKGA